MAIIKKTRDNKHWHGCTVKGILVSYCWECKLAQPRWKTVWSVLKKLKIEQPCDPAVPLPGICRKEMKPLTQKDICTPMNMTPLFPIAKTWK